MHRPGSEDMSGPPRKLEWWEKKNHSNENARGQSPVIPALRNKNSPPNQLPSRQSNRAPSVEPTMRNRAPSLDQSLRAEAPQRRSSSQAPSRRNDSPRPGSRPIRPMANAVSRQLVYINFRRIIIIIFFRNSRHSIDSADVKLPRFDRANETMRSLDQTHRELEHEQPRFHKAIQENNYDHEVFQ